MMNSEKNETFHTEGDTNRVDIGAGANVGAIAVGREIHQTIHHHHSPQTAPTPPTPELIHTYLNQVVAQKPYMLWIDRTYIERNVARSEDLFARTVMRFNPRARNETANPEALETTLARERKFVLLGEPGLGKTTSLIHVAWEAANRALASSDNAEIPLYIELKYYRGESELEALLARRVNKILNASGMWLASDEDESTRMFKAWLAQPKTRFLILLDGLNEVEDEFQTLLRDKLDVLFNTPHFIIISCRERDYDESLHNHALAFTLRGLQYHEIRDYLERALGNKTEGLFEVISRDKKIWTLAQNPLMLWLTTVVWNEERNLPANRGKLIQQFVTMMPRVRAREGTRSDVAPDIVLSTLATLSFKMQEREQVIADLSELRDWQIPTSGRSLESVLAQAKDWRFLRSDGQLGEPVEFLHQLFQEYFAAEYLRQRLAKRQAYDSILGEHPFVETWNETIVMLAGIYDRPIDLVIWLGAKVLERNDSQAAFLLQQCWETTSAVKSAEARRAIVNALTMVLNTHLNTNPSQAYSKAIEDAANAWTEVSIVDQENAVNAVYKSYATLSLVLRAIEALGRIGDEQAVQSLIKVLQDINPDTRWNAAEALGETRNIKSVEPLITVLHDSEAGVRGEAALALGKIRDARAIKPLIKLLQDVSLDVSERAESALVGIGTSAVESLIAALNNEDAIARGRAASALGSIGDRRALPKLEQMVQNDDGVMWQGRKVAEAARIAADAIRLGKKTSVK